jgi:hypothetical protein
VPGNSPALPIPVPPPPAAPPPPPLIAVAIPENPKQTTNTTHAKVLICVSSCLATLVESFPIG